MYLSTIGIISKKLILEHFGSELYDRLVKTNKKDAERANQLTFLS